MKKDWQSSKRVMEHRDHAMTKSHLVIYLAPGPVFQWSGYSDTQSNATRESLKELARRRNN